MAEQKDFIDEFFGKSDAMQKVENLSTAHTVAHEMVNGLLKLKTNFKTLDQDGDLTEQIDDCVKELNLLSDVVFVAWNKLMDGDE
jgi:hypothetical protein